MIYVDAAYHAKLIEQAHRTTAAEYNAGVMQGRLTQLLGQHGDLLQHFKLLQRTIADSSIKLQEVAEENQMLRMERQTNMALIHQIKDEMAHLETEVQSVLKVSPDVGPLISKNKELEQQNLYYMAMAHNTSLISHQLFTGGNALYLDNMASTDAIKQQQVSVMQMAEAVVQISSDFEKVKTSSAAKVAAVSTENQRLLAANSALTAENQRLKEQCRANKVARKQFLANVQGQVEGSTKEVGHMQQGLREFQRGVMAKVANVIKQLETVLATPKAVVVPAPPAPAKEKSADKGSSKTKLKQILRDLQKFKDVLKSQESKFITLFFQQFDFIAAVMKKYGALLDDLEFLSGIANDDVECKMLYKAYQTANKRESNSSYRALSEQLRESLHRMVQMRKMGVSIHADAIKEFEALEAKLG
jgi:hypothetical protein